MELHPEMNVKTARTEPTLISWCNFCSLTEQHALVTFCGYGLNHSVPKNGMCSHGT